MIKKIAFPLILMLFVSSPLWADKVINKPKAAKSTNYCHDPAKAKEWEGMRLKYPADVGILHLYALRIGLCQAVDDKKISLETAIDVFNVEHQKLIKERLQQKDPSRKLSV